MIIKIEVQQVFFSIFVAFATLSIENGLVCRTFENHKSSQSLYQCFLSLVRQRRKSEKKTKTKRISKKFILVESKYVIQTMKFQLILSIHEEQNLKNMSNSRYVRSFSVP